MHLTRVFLALLSLIACLSAQAAKVVVSIEPLAMLVEPLLGPEDSLHVLLKANTSPHHFSLKASDMQALQQADLVLWIGPELEQFLQKPMSGSAASLQLDQLSALSWPTQSGQETLQHGHDHSGRDPHIWLNPDNGIAIAKAVAQRLQVLTSTDADRLQARLADMVARIEHLASELELSLHDLGNIAFIAYHPAYGHWSKRFGLAQLGSVSLTPEQKPGARHIRELQAEAKAAQCLVAEAFYSNQSSEQLARTLNLPLVLLDPLGTKVPLGQHRYEALLRNLAIDMHGCLARPVS